MCNLQKDDSVKHLFGKLRILIVHAVYFRNSNISKTKRHSNTNLNRNSHSYNKRAHRQVEWHIN